MYVKVYFQHRKVPLKGWTIHEKISALDPMHGEQYFQLSLNKGETERERQVMIRHDSVAYIIEAFNDQKEAEHGQE